MNTPTETKVTPLSAIFPEPWDVFTCDNLEESKVGEILRSANPPDNSPHISTCGGLEKAARDFLTINGESFFKAAGV